MQQVTKNFHERAYFLQMDIKSFFPSIRKDILEKLILKKIPNGFYKDIFLEILWNDPTQNYSYK
jgi:hypothetical protein